MNRDLVRCEVSGGVATITLDNPPLNLVTLEADASAFRETRRTGAG